jgi:hypothetical protein
MDDTISFILQNQTKLSGNYEIKIKLVKRKFDNVYDTIVSTEFIEEFIKKIINTDLEIKKTTTSERLYKYNDNTYSVTETGEKNHKVEIIHKNISNIKDISIISLFLERMETNLEDFPTMMQYHDIINRNTLTLYINNLFQINIINDTNCKQSFYHIELVLKKQNIFEDKIKILLHKIITKWLEGYN